MAESNTANKPTQQEVKDAYETLYDQLTNAYWVASTIQDKDRIRGIADTVSDILDELDLEDIKLRTEQFKELSQTAASVSAHLTDLQKDIDKIIHVTKTAVAVTKAIGQVLAVTSKFFVPA